MKLASQLSVLILIFSIFSLNQARYDDDYDEYDDYDYDDLEDEFSKEDFDHDHDHKFEDADDHGHNARDIEKISKKDYKDMDEYEKLFYRFKQADQDDDDILDGLELYNQIYKFRKENYENTKRRYEQLRTKSLKNQEDGKAKRSEDRDEKEDKRREDTLKRMAKELEEEKITEYSDQSLKHLDGDHDGLITWAEYLKVVGRHLDSKQK